ncbi:MAG TPA: DUF4345 family protein [Candidatus Acidoferrales bacterium]|nr:DUF4345 family protein [Candidatus Acidoferrales bacterium]
MAFSRGLLWLNVVLFGAYGLAYLVAPDSCSQLLNGADFPTAAAAIDARAVYSGMAFGLTALLWLAARGGLELQRYGQIGCAVAYGSVAFGRLLGILVTRSPSVLTWTLLGAEASFALLSWYALRTLKTEVTSVRV